MSHVITGSVAVSETLRTRVQAAIQDLDYHPNHVARSLKTSRSMTLGIIVPDMTISFYPQIIRGAETAARAQGYSLIAVNSSESADRQKELLSLLRSQQVEGILLVVAATPAAIETPIPIVCLDRVPEEVLVDSVSVDDRSAAILGTEHLLAMGYRRLAIVTGPLTLRNERSRVLGFEESLRAAGIRDAAIWEGNLRVDDVAAMCRTRLENALRPEALLCTNGPTAIGALRAIHGLGLRIPADIAFVSFDELTVDDLFRPAITTIVQPAYDIGHRAAEILLGRIAKGREADDYAAIRLPATLKIRESSRRVLVENPEHVADQKDQQDRPQSNARAATGTPAAMAVIPSTAAQHQQENND